MNKPYDTAKILRQNVADLERELQRQRERADKAESAMATARADLQSFIDSRDTWMARAMAAEAELKAAREQEPVAWMVAHDGAQQLDLTLLKTEAEAIAREMEEEHFNHGEDGVRIPARVTPLYARPIPAPASAVPYGVDQEAANRISLAVYDWENGINPEPLLYAINRILATEAHPLSEEGQRALLQSATAAPAVPEDWLKCWLIERPASSEWPDIWLTLTTDSRRWASDGGTMYATGGDWCFTSAAVEALKFADKESADEYVRHNKIKDVVVTEHIFDNRALLQSAGGGK